MMPIIIEQTTHPITIIIAMIIMTKTNTMEFNVLVAGVLTVTLSVLVALRDSILIVDLLGVVVEVGTIIVVVVGDIFIESMRSFDSIVVDFIGVLVVVEVGIIIVVVVGAT